MSRYIDVDEVIEIVKNGFRCKRYEDEWCFRCRTKSLSNPPSPLYYIAGVIEDE